MQIFTASPSVDPWISPAVTGIFAIAGVWLGSFLNQRYGYKQAHRQQMRELRIRSYAKLMGIKVPFSQAVRTNGEAKILCEFYDVRFHLLGDRQDLTEARKQNDRALSLIPEISALRRELSETLGEIQIAFPQSEELTATIRAVYKTSAIEVPEMRGKLTSIEALEDWKGKNFSTLSTIVQTEYSDKIQHLLDLLYPIANMA